MPITEICKNYENKILNKLNIDYNHLNLCELGCQDMITSSGTIVAKNHYESFGVHHTSIDINGKRNSLKLDLNLPLPEELNETFDVVTNYGTSEHVTNQFMVFKNIHKICKINGIVINFVPIKDNWPNHCRYYYSYTFFENLCQICQYQIIDYNIIDYGFYKYPYSMIAFTYKKIQNNNFINKNDFESIPGMLDIKNNIKVDNYEP